MAVSLGGIRAGGVAKGIESGAGMVNNAVQLDQNQQQIDQKQQQAEIEQFDKQLKGTMAELGKWKQQIDITSGGEPLGKEADLAIKNVAASAIKPMVQRATQLGWSPERIKAQILDPAVRTFGGATPEQIGASEGRAAGSSDVARAQTVGAGLEIGTEEAAKAQGLIPAAPAATNISKLQRDRDTALAEGRSADAAQIEAQIGALGDPSGVTAADTISKANTKDKLKVALDTFEAQQEAINLDGQRVLDLIDEGGEGAIGAAGQVAQAMTGIQSSLIGIGQNIGVDVSQFASGKDAGEAQTIAAETFKNSKISAELQSALTGLAYAAAAANGQEGKGVSDADFKANLKQLGAGSGGAANFKNTLRTFLNASNKRFTNTFETKSRSLPEGERRKAKIFDEFKTTDGGDIDFEKLSDEELRELAK